MAKNKRDIDAFLALKRIAIIGVSRRKASYSRLVFHAFKERGFDVVPVNPAAAEIDGARCYSSLSEVRPEPESALILTPPETYAALAGECRRAGVAAVWFRQKAAPVEGLVTVEDECPVMWLRGAGWIHLLHRKWRAWTGSLPQ